MAEKLIYEVKCSVCEAIYIGDTQKTLKKKWTVISPISCIFSKRNNNKTHLLPTLDSTLDLLSHVHTYAIA